ncbi:hypothetical protein [Streptomyces sp. NPDC002467]|uniref:hypothetical protein n=1 Tax=Streptomyces sp. NPDC002467 TaxID=3364647 RepID=UPI00367CC6FF
MVISYLIGPVAVGVFRRTKPGLPRPFRLPAARILSPLTFVFAACALYRSKWPNTGIVTALTLPAAPIAALVLSRKGEHDLARQFAPPGGSSSSSAPCPCGTSPWWRPWPSVRTTGPWARA